MEIVHPHKDIQQLKCTPGRAYQGTLMVLIVKDIDCFTHMGKKPFKSGLLRMGTKRLKTLLFIWCIFIPFLYQ